MSESVMISRDRRPPPGTPNSIASERGGGKPRGGGTIGISCNKCLKPLSTTVFVCSCDCAFCDDCTYSHFNTSSNCPTCNKILTERDLMEVAIADPPSTAGPLDNTKTTMFQNLFTKQSSQSRILPFQDLCARTLRQHDDTRAGTKFLMKQFLVETSKKGQKLSKIVRAFEQLKHEYTTLKQAHNTTKMRYEKMIDNFQTQLSVSNKKLEEKERQLHQFRKLHDSMTPESPSNQVPHSSRGGTDARRVSNGSSSTHLVPGSRQQAPPMRGFMIQKEEQERARQRAMEHGTPRPPIMGHLHPTSQRNPYATPMHKSQDSGGSGGGYGKNGPRSMSPSQAFGMQPPGSYSVSRGPSNYYRQGPHNGGAMGYSSSHR